MQIIEVSMIGVRSCVLRLARRDWAGRRRRKHESITVAIVYGAQHVAPVVHGMHALHRYGVRSAEWLTVFSL